MVHAPESSLLIKLNTLKGKLKTFDMVSLKIVGNGQKMITVGEQVIVSPRLTHPESVLAEIYGFGQVT